MPTITSLGHSQDGAGGAVLGTISFESPSPPGTAKLLPNASDEGLCCKKKKMQKFLLIAVAVLFVATQPVFATPPTWAKKAIAFPEKCLPGKTEACKPLRIPAPDGKSIVDVRYRKDSVSDSEWAVEAYLRVTSPGKGTREAALPEGFQNTDLLWSPDSRAFFVNGGNGGAYWGFWVYVYLLKEPKLEPIDVTQKAQRDMLKEFPPCKAAFPNGGDARGCDKTSRNIDLEKCMKEEADPNYNPEYNMTGIDWVNASTILVMAEVPCSSSYGGIMCQVMGYELEVPSGHILKRIEAKELKLNWQKSMEWKFRMPDPPQYCE